MTIAEGAGEFKKSAQKRKSLQKEEIQIHTKK